MPPFIDITGKRFARLTVVRLIGADPIDRVLRWECLCDCGKTIMVRAGSLRTGNTKSCGCYEREKNIARSTKHGLAYSRAYRIFHAMHRRCYYEPAKDFYLYGGRGITVCERWRKPDGFVNFIADMGEPPEGLTIDRINVNGNYEPENCQWATVQARNNNKRNTRLIQWNGKTLTLTAWAKILNRDAAWLWRRLKKYPLEKAMEPFN